MDGIFSPNIMANSVYNQFINLFHNNKMPIELNIFTIALVIILFLIAALPLKNYLEIKRFKKIQKKWDNWLSKKPNLVEYCKEHKQGIENPLCDYCGAKRHISHIEYSITNIKKFGLINNSYDGNCHYKTFICSGCGSQLYREKTIYI